MASPTSAARLGVPGGSQPIGNDASDFIRAYVIDVPDPTSETDASYCAHREVWPTVAAVAGRRMEGAKLYFCLTNDAARHAYDGIAVSNGHMKSIDAAAAKFLAWFDSLFLQPQAGNDNAWAADRVEY